MTLLRDLIAIPKQVHKSDFVISLDTAIADPTGTLADYVVTPQLRDCFDRALSLVATSVSDHRSKAAYLHASFGSGKTAMMSVLHLLLHGDPAARAVPELAPLVAKYSDRLDGRRFLLVPFHFIGKSSMEQEVLGGYVDHVRKLHPGAALPAVYVADGILTDVPTKRWQLGDEVFLRILSDGESGGDEWGSYGGAWDAPALDAALLAAPGSSERDRLVGALLRTHYSALPGQAQTTAEGFVPLDDGLEAISRHAKDLGYDAVVLLLDELVLWLASRMSDVDFVSREGAKVAQLVEADAAGRPAPIVSFIARQRDLRELVGEHVPGAASLSAIDVLRYSEGRFDTITLEDRNLPAIVERRLLRPLSVQARQTLDDAFERVRTGLDERNEADVLLSESGDLAAFRRLYPFSPALVDALVALSGAMQRERTALKVMLQLLVEGREHLQVGELIPLGDLFDAVNAGDEPLTEVMRSQFAQARRLWSTKFAPMLWRDHGLNEESARHLPPSHAFVTDARLAKSLLIAALVPEVAPLRALTVSRLSALNSGTVRAFIPGTERQAVLDRLRRWQSEIGELRLGDDDADPTVAVALTGIDTAPILDAARIADSDGARRLVVRRLLFAELDVREPDCFEPFLEIDWRGTRRRVDLVFGNVRDLTDLPDERLRAGTVPKLVLDYPFDASREHGAVDDRSRIMDFRNEHEAEWSAAWLPNHFSAASSQLLGRLLRLDHVLSGDMFDSLAGYLAPSDRVAARSQLVNEQVAVRARVQEALRQAYGVDPADPLVVSVELRPAEQYTSLDPALELRPPVGTSLRTAAVGLADQLYRSRYPAHPEYTERVSRAERVTTLREVTRALGEPNGRLENVDVVSRKVLTKVAGPASLGTMHAAHFIADVQGWVDVIERSRSSTGSMVFTVTAARGWLDQAQTPSQRRGLINDDADLILLAVAAATNRVLVDGGRPVPGAEIGQLRPDWELVAHDLPDLATWELALQRANDMGVVPVSRLRSVTAVADLTGKLRDLGSRTIDGAGSLVRSLDAAQHRLGLDRGTARSRTAQSGLDLVMTLARRPEQAIVALAGAEVPTTVAAIGTSLEQAARVAAALDNTNWALLDTAFGLAEPFSAEAEAMRERLVDALGDDELTVALVRRLADATTAATDLVGRATRRPSPAPPAAPVPAGPTPGSGPASGSDFGSSDSALGSKDGPVGAGAPVDFGASRDPGPGGPTWPITELEANAQLENLRDRLRDELGVTLTWELRRDGDADR